MKTADQILNKYPFSKHPDMIKAMEEYASLKVAEAKQLHEVKDWDEVKKKFSKEMPSGLSAYHIFNWLEKYYLTIKK